MKEELLRSVARPAMVFYAPFRLVIVNLLLHMLAIFTLLAFGRGGYIWAPIITFILIHPLLILIGNGEPHIDTMLAASFSVKRRTKNMIREDGNKFAA